MFYLNIEEKKNKTLYVTNGSALGSMDIYVYSFLGGLLISFISCCIKNNYNNNKCYILPAKW